MSQRAVYKEAFENAQHLREEEFQATLRLYQENFSKIEIEYTEKLSTLASSITSTLAEAVKLEEIQILTQEYHDKIIKLHNELLIDDGEHLSIQGDIEDSKKTIDAVYSDIQKIKREIFGYIKETIGEPLSLTEYNALPENQKYTKNSSYYKLTRQKIIGVVDEIKSTVAEYKQEIENDKLFIIDREKAITIKVEELFSKIESLLPGATTSGLSEAFNNSKNEQKGKITLWTWIFYLTLSSTAAMIIHLVEIKAINLTQITDAGQSIIQFLRLISFEFPFIWMAIVANKKISQHTRLYEEYSHKWAIARTFEGMKNVIQQSEIEEQDHHIDKLFSSLLDSVSYNPSTTLDKVTCDDSPLNNATSLLKDMVAKKVNTPKQDKNV